ILQYGLPLNQHDLDSMTYLRSVIETDRYISEPFRCAHQYPRTELIAYHTARLIGSFDPAPLKPIRQKLINDCYQLLEKAKHIMDRVVLSIALLRLGETPPRIDISHIENKDFKGFYFFIAGLMTAYENPILYRIAASPVFHMYWECEAHCWILLAEDDVVAGKI